jgi:IMP dehydrogenase
MVLIDKVALGFDDITLVPQYSSVISRANINLDVALKNSNIKLRLPFISAPMDTVSDGDFCLALAKLGGLGIIHRYCSIPDQVKMFRKVYDNMSHLLSDELPVGVAIGATGDFLERAEELYHYGVRLFCVDIAHGHHVHMEGALTKLKQKFPRVHIMSGNVATPAAYKDLSNWGSDSIRVGVSNGSVCSTRVMTGHGLPSFTTVAEIKETADCYDGTLAQIILDGGIKNSGDICKALGAGADLVMMGSLFAGTDESPGKVIDGKKVYQGMSSRAAQEAWRGYASSDEGIATLIPQKGSLVEVVKNLENGLRSGMSYSGASDLKNFQAAATFRTITTSGMIEGTPHILRG